MTGVPPRLSASSGRISASLRSPMVTKIGAMVGTNLLVPLMALAVAPILARELGAEGRGIYTALTAPVLLAGIIGTLGLQDGLSQFISRRGLSARKALKTSLISVLALSILTGGLMFLLGFLLFDDQQQRLEYTLVLTTIPVLIGHNLLIGIATGSSDTTGLNGTKLIPAAVRALVVVILCIYTDMTALTGALLLLIAPALGIIWQTHRILRKRHPVRSEVTGTRPEDVTQKQLLRFSMAAFPGVLAAMLMTRADQVLGISLLGAEQLGLYAIAVTVAELPMMVANAGRSYILGSRKSPADGNRVPRVAWFILGGNALICIVLMALVPWAIPWVFGASFQGSVMPCVILLLGTICYTAMSLGSALLLSDGRAHSQSIAYLLAACVGIAMLYALCDLGAPGAALASLTGYAVAAILSWALIHSPKSALSRTSV